MTDSIFKRMGSVISSKIDTLEADIVTLRTDVNSVSASQGVAEGVATLDTLGKLESSQIPTVPMAKIAGVPHDIYGAIYGMPKSNQVDSRFISTKTFVIPANCAGSLSKSSVAATSSTVLSLQKNSIQFATITYGAGQVTGIFSTQAEVTFVPGDRFSIKSPASPDATLADVDFAIIALMQ